MRIAVVRDTDTLRPVRSFRSRLSLSVRVLEDAFLPGGLTVMDSLQVSPRLWSSSLSPGWVSLSVTLVAPPFTLMSANATFT